MEVCDQERTNNFRERKRARISEARLTRIFCELASTLAEDLRTLERFEGTLPWQVRAMGEVKWILSESRLLLQRNR